MAAPQDPLSKARKQMDEAIRTALADQVTPRLDSIEGRLGGVEGRLGGVEKSLQDVSQKLDLLLKNSTPKP